MEKPTAPADDQRKLSMEQFTDLLIRYQQNFEKEVGLLSWRLPVLVLQMLYMLVTCGKRAPRGLHQWLLSSLCEHRRSVAE